jgi:hypothetical protein
MKLMAQLIRFFCLTVVYAYALIKFALDMTSRATLFDNPTHTLSSLEKGLNWLFSTPWEVPAILAFCATILLFSPGLLESVLVPRNNLNRDTRLRFPQDSVSKVSRQRRRELAAAERIARWVDVDDATNEFVARPLMATRDDDFNRVTEVGEACKTLQKDLHEARRKANFGPSGGVARLETEQERLAWEALRDKENEFIAATTAANRSDDAVWEELRRQLANFRLLAKALPTDNPQNYSIDVVPVQEWHALKFERQRYGEKVRKRVVGGGRSYEIACVGKRRRWL